MKLSKHFHAAVAAIGITALSACADQVTDHNGNTRLSRPLTPGEITMAQEIFGNQIDYSAVQIARFNSNRSKAFNGLIRFSGNAYSNDFSQDPNMRKKEVFIHEMAHMWQEQLGIDVVDSAIGLWFRNGGQYDNSLYHYTKRDIPNFARLNIEQQAHIIENYYSWREYVNNSNKDYACDEIETYEQTLKRFLPHLQTPEICQ
ncbi:MAG: hypothetical protein ACLFR0_08685 [Alphaproteobacteria bacterium]